METDTNVVDLIDSNKYLMIDDCDFDFPLFEHGISETGGIFGSACKRPAKKKKTSNVVTTNKSSTPSSSSDSSQLICFEDSNSSPIDTLNLSNLFDQYGQGMSERKDCPRKRQVLLKENVLAERKRRQKLNESLIALSALVPGRKKADKVTVLEDTIKYLKQLQERIEQLKKENIFANNRMESVMLVKKSLVCIDEDSSSPPSLSDEDLDSQFSNQTLPRIEARVSSNDLLIRIHCEKSNGCLAKILSEIDKLGLSVINSFTLPFGNSTFDITILTKMDENFSRSVKDVVKNIRLAIVD